MKQTAAALTALFLLIGLPLKLAQAQDPRWAGERRAAGNHSSVAASASSAASTRLIGPGSSGSRRIVLAPITLSGGSNLTLITPSEWVPLGRQLAASLSRAHTDFSKLFGNLPAFSTALRLLDEDAFYLSTGAPHWTNAMFYRGQILIPLSQIESVDMPDLRRSIRHEYTHALIHALSGGKAPGWLDEGLAQWAEGVENPALQPALLRWLQGNEPVPLAFLQGGFTRLQAEMVPAAYAQSLFATRRIMSDYGFEKVRLYFSELKNGSDKATAFETAFGISEAQFEQSIQLSLASWVSEKGKLPNQKAQSPVHVAAHDGHAH
jgi:hypothetical protein